MTTSEVPRSHARGVSWDDASCHCDAHRIVELAQMICDSTDVRAARQGLIRYAAATLDTPWIALARPFEPGEIGFVGTSDATVQKVVRIEQRLHEGPTWDVYWDDAPVVSDDLRTERRWHDYVREVTAASTVRSVLALPLRAGPDTVGGLVAYAEGPGHFTATRFHAASMLAAQAAVALAAVASRTKASNLEVALETNREIATAVGIVMERCRLTDDQAFAFLRESSQRTHLKLRDVAARVAVTGEVPTVVDPDR